MLSAASDGLDAPAFQSSTELKCEHGWEQPLGGLKSSCSPGVNEGVRLQWRCTTSLPFAPVLPQDMLYTFSGRCILSGGRGNTRVQT